MLKQVNAIRTSTGLYRSCAALASFSGTLDLILFEAVNFQIVEKVWFGLVCFNRPFGQTYKINDFGLLWLSLVWFV